jgi:hypothetical protein
LLEQNEKLNERVQKLETEVSSQKVELNEMQEKMLKFEKILLGMDHGRMRVSHLLPSKFTRRRRQSEKATEESEFHQLYCHEKRVVNFAETRQASTSKASYI